MIRRTFFAAVASLLAFPSKLLQSAATISPANTKPIASTGELLTKTSSREICAGILLECWELPNSLARCRWYVRDLNKGKFTQCSYKEAFQLLHHCPSYRMEQAILEAQAIQQAIS